MKLIDLPVGTTFYVVNGDWRGEIILNKDFDKAVKILPNHTKKMSYGYCYDPCEIDILRTQHQTQQYKKITKTDDLELTEIEYPIDTGITQESSKEYFDYLFNEVKNE